MNQTHLHLLITHLPIFGLILGGIVLSYGLSAKSNDTKIASYLLFMISSIGAGIAYLTGEAAEETVEHIQGIVESNIKTHEEFALFAISSMIILVVVSILGVYLTYRKSLYTRTTAFTILTISLVCFGLVARTGYLGGQIRHTEIANNPNNSSEDSENEKEEE
jgi:uncharacterized membrane protein